ncbi:MAG: hypothetical protein PHP92_03430 [Candidatus Nanoarchaeia archaeon]|nr:hypothetical protein [Candidatus Nanoarchaeia archaeon]
MKHFCKQCGKELKYDEQGETSTLLGYNPEDYENGHNHDDNCIVRTYICSNGHEEKLSIINKCPICDWTGEKECFCSRKIKGW